MIQTVHQFLREGDYEISAREILNRFATEHCVAEADVHNAPGAVTVILLDDPPQALVDVFEGEGWTHQVIWRRG